MNPAHSLESPGLKAVMLAVLVGVLARIGILANNTYYQNIGMPYILALPGAATVGVGILYYLRTSGRIVPSDYHGLQIRSLT